MGRELSETFQHWYSFSEVKSPFCSENHLTCYSFYLLTFIEPNSCCCSWYLQGGSGEPTEEEGSNKIYKHHHFQSLAFLYFHLCSHVKLPLDILQLSQLWSVTPLFSHPAVGPGNEDGTNIYAFNMTNNRISLKLLPGGQYHRPCLYQWSGRTETEL